MKLRLWTVTCFRFSSSFVWLEAESLSQGSRFYHRPLARASSSDLTNLHFWKLSSELYFTCNIIMWPFLKTVAHFSPLQPPVHLVWDQHTDRAERADGRRPRDSRSPVLNCGFIDLKRPQNVRTIISKEGSFQGSSLTSTSSVKSISQCFVPDYPLCRVNEIIPSCPVIPNTPVGE